MKRALLFLLVLCFPVVGLAEQIPPPLSSSDIPAPLVDPVDATSSPSPVPVPRDVQPPVPVPRDVQPPVPVPRDVRHPVPPPSADDLQLPEVSPVPSPWELTEQQLNEASWESARCYIKQRGNYRELRCQMPLEQAPQVQPRTPISRSCGSVEETRVLELVNDERKAKGLSPLSCAPDATVAARGHSQDMCIRGYFSHQSPEGQKPWHRLKKAAAENIAKGYSSPEGVVAGWMKSPGHRANILGAKFTRLGVGFVYCDGRPLWTQVFVR